MNAEIIKLPNGDFEVKLEPESRHEKFIIDANEILRQQQEDLEECVARNTQVNVEYGELCKSYDQLKQQNVHLAEQSTHVGLTDLQNRIIQLEASLAHMQDQRDAAYQRHNERFQEIQGFKDAENSFREQIGSLQYENKKLNGLIEHYKKQRNDWESGFNTLTEEVQTLHEKIKSDENDWNDSLQRNIKLTDEITKLKHQSDSLKSVNGDWRKAADKTALENAELKRQLTERQDQNEKWSESFMNNDQLWREINERLGKENEELKRKLAAMTQTVFDNAPKKLPSLVRDTNYIKLFASNGLLIEKWNLQYEIDPVKMANTIADAFTNDFPPPFITKDENDLP